MAILLKSLLEESSVPRKIVAYHGSNSDISEFSMEKLNDYIKSNRDSTGGVGNEAIGSGVYFTDSKELAEKFGKNIYTCELSFKKPIVLKGNKTLRDLRFTPTQAFNVIKHCPTIMSKEESPLGDWFEEYWEKGPSDSMISRLVRDKNYNWNPITIDTGFFNGLDPIVYRQAVYKGTGYDSVIHIDKGVKVYVAWFDEQIKILKKE